MGNVKTFFDADNSQGLRRTGRAGFAGAIRMSSLKFTLLAAVSLAASIYSRAAADLTLEQALRSVEAVNINVLLSREATIQALAFANQQRVGLLPNIGLSAQQRRTEGVGVSTTGLLTQTPASNRFDGKLTGSLSLLNPQQISAYRAARAGVAVAEADYQATLQSILSTVAQFYFAQLHDVRRIAVLDANVARAKALFDLAQNQLNAGIATQIDVTRAESQLALAQQARLQQDTVVYQSALQLQRLLDLKPAEPIVVTDFLVRRSTSGDYSLGLEQSSFARRSDWLRAQKAVEQAKLDLRTAKFERLPILGLSGEYGYAAADAFNNDSKQAWTAGATITMPLFDGLRSTSDQRIALSRQRAQEARLRGLELQISAELRLAQQDAGSRFAQITVAEKSLALAEKEVRLAKSRLDNGAADNREVIEAQNRLAVASDGLNDAVFQYNLSRVELSRAKGDVRDILLEKQ